mmetsp:Transcript_20195/g.55949  ORF Transcript_20195/g.55949 Transcript_20195/m.55949 type:complete len:275 (-) Transcript_20195:7-831(-)
MPFAEAEASALQHPPSFAKFSNESTEYAAVDCVSGSDELGWPPPAMAIEPWNVATEASSCAEYLVTVDLKGFGNVTIRELGFADGVHGSTGNQLWPTSVALGNLILEEPGLVAGKSVLELGAGCGFASVIAARFARRLVVTDLEAETLDNARHNLMRNATLWWSDTKPIQMRMEEVTIQQLDWKRVEKFGWPQDRRVDVVIGSDIIYGNWGGLIAQVVHKLILPGGVFIMMSAEDRCGLEFFEEAMVAVGFDVQRSHRHDTDTRYLLYICYAGL